MKRIMMMAAIAALALNTQAGTIGWGWYGTEGIPETLFAEGDPVIVMLVLGTHYDALLDRAQDGGDFPTSLGGMSFADGIVHAQNAAGMLDESGPYYFENDNLYPEATYPLALFVFCTLKPEYVAIAGGTHLLIYYKIYDFVAGYDEADFDARNPDKVLGSFDWDGGAGFLDWYVVFTPIPEPATGLLALAGVALLIRRKRR